MIGIGPLVSAGAGVVLLVAAVGAGAPDPAARREADQLVESRARSALEALDALEAALARALEAAREGVALGSDGDEPPSVRLDAAAEAVEGAVAEADAADRAVAALEAARRARDAWASRLPPGVTSSELRSIAADLRSAGPGADAVGELRRGTTRLLEAVDSALAALLAGDLDDARAGAGSARAEHDRLRVSNVGSDTLVVWLETTDAMISTVSTLIEATAAGDRAAADAAAASFARLGEDAGMADRALEIALSERAGASTRAAGARLASAVTSLEALRTAVVAGRPSP